MDQVNDMEGAACMLPPDPESTAGETRGAQPSSALSRRSFIKIGLGALSTLALLEMGGAGVMFLRARSLDGEFGGVITAGILDDFPPGSVTELADSQFFLVRTADGGLLAVHSRCTHLGCTVNWVPAENQFVCPCHAAVFDFYGDFQSPPVPRPLDTFPIEIEDAQVLVDTSRPQRRETFKPEQLTYAPQGQPSKSS